MSEPAPRWCHVTVTTYGNWLPGDPRGFRTRNHREHVEGDYKSPPTVDYRERHEASRRRLLAPPTRLDPAQCRVAALALRERLEREGVLVACVGMTCRHGHVLGRFPAGDVREFMGRAKKHTSFKLHEAAWNGRVWGRACGITAVTDREHQMNVYRSILRHERQGAFVWACHRDP